MSRNIIKSRIGFVGVVFFLALAIPLFGCGARGRPPLPLEQVQNLDSILSAYFQAVDSLPQPPKNEKELKPFLEALGDPATLRVSPRDHQPYTIVWGIDPRTPTDMDD